MLLSVPTCATHQCTKTTISHPLLEGPPRQKIHRTGKFSSALESGQIHPGPLSTEEGKAVSFPTSPQQDYGQLQWEQRPEAKAHPILASPGPAIGWGTQASRLSLNWQDTSGTNCVFLWKRTHFRELSAERWASGLLIFKSLNDSTFQK